MKTKPVKVPWLDPVNSPKNIHPRSGDVYQFAQNVSTRAGHNHLIDTLLYVHEMTHEKPHGEVGPRGFNWLCRTYYGVSVWSTLESCIERGLLVKVPRRLKK